MFPLCLLFAAATQGQIQIDPQPAPPGISKVVVHDQGGLWPTALARHSDGSVTAFGNPWLGGQSSAVAGLSGVLDLARLDAMVVGDTESVVAVGSSGLTTVRWDAILRGFALTPFVDPALAGAPIVRAAAFPTHHLLSVVTADRLSVRCYRGTGTHLSTIASPTVIRDLELFKNAGGAARLVVRTDAVINCHGLNGTLFWTATGSGGALVRWPQSATVRAAWLHQPGPGGNWQLAMLGDTGVLSTASLAHALAPTDSVKAAFAADADRDGDIDLVVKSSSGVSVLAVPASGDFGSSVVTALTHLAPSAASTPDLVATHAGQRLRYVDEFGGSGVGWERVDLPSIPLQGGPEESISLEVLDPPIGSLVGGEVDRDLPGTHINFALQTTAEGLLPFVAPNSLTRLQIVAWIQDDTTGRGSLVDQSESNLLLTLQNAPQTPQDDWRWPVYVDLLPTCTDSGWSDVQTQNRHYWLTVRLCRTPIGSTVPTAVSEPITLVTSLAEQQAFSDWAYLREYYFNFEDELPQVNNPMQGMNGGGVVGVIQRADLPPPPPPSGIPTPRANTAQGQVTGTQVLN
jgi:hypothetical protein